MRISDTKELGKILQKEFGGKLTTKSDQIEITNTHRTTAPEIQREITKYYVKTLGCVPYSQMPAFENKKGFEAIRLTYTPKPTNKILISIIEV
jgi:hypothetical protein